MVAVLAFVRLRFGGGKPYPDLTTTPLRPDSLEVLIELDRPPGNVTSSADGRIFFNTHPISAPGLYGEDSMFELIDGEPVPYPSAELQKEFKSVFGMTVDTQNRLWLIEPAGLEDHPTRLFAFDLATDELVFDHSFPKGVAPLAQDLRVSPDGKTVYLADTGLFSLQPGGLLVFDVESKTVRELLYGHPTTSPQNWVMRIHGKPFKVGFGLVSWQVGVDGIELTDDGQWLYFGPMSHDTLYRIETKYLLDAALSDDALAEHIEAVGTKPQSDGITLDPDGNILITDIEHNGIARMTPSGDLKTLALDERILWSDGVNVMDDGTILLTDSGIPSYATPFMGPPSRELVKSGAPYRIYRIRPQPGM